MAAASRRPRSTPVTTIFFDLDNTLIETRNADRLACEKVSYVLVTSYGLTAEVAVQITQSFLCNFRKCPENLDFQLDEWRQLLWENALGKEYSYLSGDVYSQWLELRYQCLALSAEVKSLLHSLRQTYLLALITNGPSRSQWEKIVRLNLQTSFDCVLVSGDLMWEKPCRKIFQQACQELNVAPENCIMVGDKLETDIVGAIKALLGGNVWVPYKETNGNVVVIGNIKPDYVIENVTQLPYLLPFKRKNSLSNSRHGISSRRTLTIPDIDMEDCNSNSSDGS